MSDLKRTLELHQLAVESQETMRAAVRKAKAESRQKGVPISFSINGTTYYELPNGEISRENPWKNQDSPGT